MDIIGEIHFQGKALLIYDSIDEPWFRAVEIARFLHYADGKTYHMLDLLDNHDKLPLEFRGSGQRRMETFISENGLYEILMRSTRPMAKAFKRVVKDELRSMRRDGFGFGSAMFDRRATDLEHQEELAYLRFWDHENGEFKEEYWDYRRRGSPRLIMRPDGEILEA